MFRSVKHALVGWAILGIGENWQSWDCSAQTIDSPAVAQQTPETALKNVGHQPMMEKPFEPLDEFAEGEAVIRDLDGAESEDFHTAKSPEVRKAKVSKEIPAVRLPRYFAGLVNTEQRSQIRHIQLEFRSRIAQLEDELEKLRREELMEMELVLTASQRKLLEKKRQPSRSSSGATGGAAQSQSTEHPDPSDAVNDAG